MNFKQFRSPANNHGRRSGRNTRVMSKLGSTISAKRLEQLLADDKKKTCPSQVETVSEYLMDSKLRLECPKCQRQDVLRAELQHICERNGKEIKESPRHVWLCYCGHTWPRPG